MHALIVGRSPQTAPFTVVKQALASFPDFSEPEFAATENVERKRLETKAELIVVLLAEGQPNGLEVLRRIRETFTGPLIVVGEIADPKLILRSLQLGADQFVDVAELETEFSAALRRLLRRPAAEESLGKLVAVLSASGGCGASTLAVNLAALRAREHGLSVLVDLNLRRGDLPALLDLKPQFSLADVCLNEGRLDQAMLGKMLVRHACGVHLLSSPPDFADCRSITPSGLRHALGLLRVIAPEVVVDLEDCFHAEQVEVLQQATGVLLVCRLEFTSLRNARRLLDHMAKLEVQRSRIKVVVNLHGQPGELPVEEAEDALNEKIAAIIPHDPKPFHLANNTGMPVVLADPNSKAVKSIMELAHVPFEEVNAPSRIVRSLKGLLKGVLNIGS
jgi:pilus assembly protein CpaE